MEIAGTGAGSPSSAGTGAPAGGGESAPAAQPAAPAPSSGSSAWGSSFDTFMQQQTGQTPVTVADVESGQVQDPAPPAPAVEPQPAAEGVAAPSPETPAADAAGSGEQTADVDEIDTANGFPAVEEVTGPEPVRKLYGKVLDRMTAAEAIVSKFGGAERAKSRAAFFDTLHDPSIVANPDPALAALAKENPVAFDAMVNRVVSDERNRDFIAHQLFGRSAADVARALEGGDPDGDGSEFGDGDGASVDPEMARLREENARLSGELTRQQSVEAQAAFRQLVEKTTADMTRPAREALEKINLGDEFNALKDFVFWGAQDIYRMTPEGGRNLQRLNEALGQKNDGAIQNLIPTFQTEVGNRVTQAVGLLSKLVQGYHRSIELERAALAASPPPVTGATATAQPGAPAAPAAAPKAASIDPTKDGAWGKLFDQQFGGQ